MARFIQHSQCVMKTMVKTEPEVTPVAIAPLQARTSPPTSCRPRPRIVRPWEDAPSPRSAAPSPPTTPQSSTPKSSTPTCPSNSPVTPHQVSSSQLVLQQDVMFLRAISRLQVKVSTSDTWLATLASSYLSEVLRLEASRSQATSCSPPALHAAVHRHYDAERLALLQKANSSLMGYSCTLAAASSRAATLHQEEAATPPTTPTTMPPTRITHSLDRSYSSGSGASSPECTPTAPSTARLERIAARLEGSTCSSTTPASKRLLSPLAVRHLEDWYYCHQEHPYADAAQARQLAADGGITKAQVRKWLANRRLRHHRSGSSSTTSSRRQAHRTLVNFQ